MIGKPEFTGPELCALGACEVVDLLKRGEVSSRELLDAAYARIETVESAVNAMPTLCRERAYAAADQLDGGEAGHPGWLAGLPVGIKDLAEVKGVRTTFGTEGFADNLPDKSDLLVTRLEARGAVVAGKTNTPELGAGGNTFNAVFGRTLNPWDTRLNAAGSSGGAAVSLATGELWLSHGSDHGGSLRTPAAYNGVVGLRPSPGRVASQSELGFITEGQQGPMARSVEDCALFLDAMSGFAASVPSSHPAPEVPFRSAVQQATQKLRIAFAPDLGGFSQVEPVIDAHMRAALGAVERNGGTVEETCPDIAGLETAYHVLRGVMWAAIWEAFPADKRHHFKQTLVGNIEFGQSLSIGDITQANLTRSRIFDNMHGLFQDFDVLALPAVGNMPRLQSEEWVHQVNGVEYTGYMDWLRFAFLATTTGLPAISVPVGLTDEALPVAIQLVGKPRGEAGLLAAARAVEIAVGGPLGVIDPNLRIPEPGRGRWLNAVF